MDNEEKLKALVEAGDANHVHKAFSDGQATASFLIDGKGKVGAVKVKLGKMTYYFHDTKWAKSCVTEIVGADGIKRKKYLFPYDGWEYGPLNEPIAVDLPPLTVADERVGFSVAMKLQLTRFGSLFAKLKKLLNLN